MEKVRKYLADSRKVAEESKPESKLQASIPAMKLPNAPHPEVFDGTPDLFPMWKAAFHTLVGKYDIVGDEKMYYLKQYTTCLEILGISGILATSYSQKDMAFFKLRFYALLTRIPFFFSSQPSGFKRILNYKLKRKFSMVMAKESQT